MCMHREFNSNELFYISLLYFFYFVVVDKRVSSLQLMHIHTFLTGIKSHV